MAAIDKWSGEYLLKCRHCCNGKKQPPHYYKMKCNLIKEMSDGRVKVKVFGNRNWRDTEDKSSRIRYVKAGNLCHNHQLSNKS